jgi:hypothetical protein
MISDNCDFNEFVRQAKGRDYQDIIYLADREATEAERRFYHSAMPDDAKNLCGQGYAQCLKGFIAFMRYGIKPADIAPEDLTRLDLIRKEALQNKRSFPI